MNRLLRYSAIAFLAVSLAACQSVQHIVETGDYDAAIDLSIRKLRGKKNKKVEYVKALELAFQKAQARDLRIADHLIAADRPENWERVNQIHKQIYRRQLKISALLPLQAKDGYKARFTFVHIEKLEQESRERAAGYLYDCAEDLLGQAGRGNRQAARDAYDKLTELESSYFRNFRNSEALKRLARELGTAQILFEVRNDSRQILPPDFNQRVLRFSLSDLNSTWKSFHLEEEPGILYDYRVRFNVRSVDLSPERVAERSYIDEKEIQDGWDYVLDERGNVKKDTAGNDIKTPRYVTIRANILEVYQTKAVRMRGAIEIFPGDRNTLIDSQDLNTEVLFEHYASTFQGDRRALSESSRQRIGNRPLPFPPTEDMLVQAAEQLKPAIRDAIRGNRMLQ